MESEEFKRYLNEEIEEIKKYRDEQMKKGKSSEESSLEWVKKYAKTWRVKWNKKNNKNLEE